MDPLAMGEVERSELVVFEEDEVGMGPPEVALKVTWLEVGRREEKWDGEEEERPDCIVEADPRDELIEGDDPELDDAG